jgi:hypothetical protein
MVRRIAVVVGLWGTLLPVQVAAQLQPGVGQVLPAFGARFSATDMLATTTRIAYYPPEFVDAFGPPPPEVHEDEDVNPVSTEISLDPGTFFGLRYAYNVTRRLAVEVEFNTGISVFVIQMLELLPEMEGEPQFETTTLDARIYQYFLNLSYHVGRWRAVHPFLSLGVGGQTMNLRQKGAIKTDPIKDAAVMAGIGIHFRGNDRLGIRLELRDFMYNFYFDNQFANDLSYLIVANRDVGRAVAVADPRFQNDLVLTLGFQVRVH